MSLNVDVYLVDETGEMVLQESEDYSETLAGFESCRACLYGSDLARSLGLRLLPALAGTNVFATGSDVTDLQAEAEVILGHAAAFAEQAELDAEYVRKRVENIRQACIRAKRIQGSVVIW